MGAWILRGLLLIICATSGYYLAATGSSFLVGIWGALAGIVVAFLTFLLEEGLRKVPFKNLIGGFIGLILGVILANLISNIFFSDILINHLQIVLPLYGGLYGICGYICLRLGYTQGDALHFAGLKFFSDMPRSENTKILDTSVIIDGRIADITETGFVEGAVLIPQFVLSELHHIADSSDPIKRTRGKRGLEVLHHIQKQANVDVKIVDTDYPAVKEVDSKLIELAKQVHGKIVTNDANLNKVAELQGIVVLNINELANSLKPVVLPGEEMNVKILKEGKEAGQGIAYLDDGTMIVVDNGKRQMGKAVEIIVTSVLQTPAGRMIFGRLKEEAAKDNKGKDFYYPLDSGF
jgi:uncharacterized protein YacL